VSGPIPISRKNGNDYFHMEKLSPGAVLTDFNKNRKTISMRKDIFA
jgi:hypothetical protein